MIFVNLLALPNLGHENDSAHSKTSARDVALKFFGNIYYVEILLPPTFPNFSAGMAATFRKTDFLPAY